MQKLLKSVDFIGLNSFLPYPSIDIILIPSFLFYTFVLICLFLKQENCLLIIKRLLYE